MDEYISREEVLSRIYATHSTGGFANEEAYLWLHDEITNLAADVQPAKHAKWISYGRDNDWMKYYRCSSCSSEIVDASGLAEVRKKYRFCPQCGCKMDGDSNGKD